MYIRSFPSTFNEVCTFKKNSKMKKLFFFAIIAMAMVSCNEQSTSSNLHFGKQTFVVSNDTTIDVIENITARRYSCSGELLKHPKLLEEVKLQKKLYFTNAVTIDVDSLISASPAFAGLKKSLDDASKSSWLYDFLKVLAAIALIALLVWFLWWLFNQRPTSSTGSTSSAAPGVAALAAPIAKPDVKPVTSATSNSSASTSSITKEDYEGINAILVELHKSSAGGKVQLGSLVIEIPNAVPNIHIEANGTNGTVKDVNIDVTTVSAANVNAYAGDNNSQFTRGAKPTDEQAKS